ncbi:hypothetical protein [Halorussus halobius]|nr:hypothetical protein [Halorussus halobius]
MAIVEFKIAFDDIRNVEAKSESELEEEIAERTGMPVEHVDLGRIIG